MNLKPGSYFYSIVEDFIKNHLDLIAEGDFDSIFSKANNNPPLLKPALYEFMTEAGIDIEFTGLIPNDLWAEWTDSPAEYKVSPGVTRLGEWCFSGSGVEEVKLPDSVSKIGGRCFYDAKKLKSINLPEKLTILGPYCFSRTEALKTLKFPPILLIPKGSCSNSLVEEVIISEGTKGIAERAFRLCTCLKSIKLPRSLAYVEDQVFTGCAALESMDYAGTMEEWKKVNLHPGAFDPKRTIKVKCTDGEIGAVIK